DRPHARPLPDRPAGQAAEGVPDPDGVLGRRPVRAGHRARGGQPAARAPEARQPAVPRRHPGPGPDSARDAARRCQRFGFGGRGQSRFVVFFGTWLSETSDLKAEPAGVNANAKDVSAKPLPQLTAVDEAVTEPSSSAVDGVLSSAGALDYQVGLDQTGRLAD